jgi:transposase
MTRKRPEYDENVVKRVARKLYEIFYAGKAYKKIIKPKKKKKITTTRTGAVERRLKEAGITKKRIKRLRD